MACIHEKLANSLNKEIASQVIWEKLDTMYDMAALVRILLTTQPEKDPNRTFCIFPSARI